MGNIILSRSGGSADENRLPHLACYEGFAKLGGAGGFACRANFSRLLSLRLSTGTGCVRKRPLADAWVIWQARVTG